MKEKVAYWFYSGCGLIMAIGVALGIIAGTQASRQYDERAYLLVLTLLALVLSGKFMDWAKEAKRKVEEEKGFRDFLKRQDEMGINYKGASKDCREVK